TTAMTGHQDHPGTGKTLMGQVAPIASIAAIGKACGIKRVRTIDPHDMAATVQAIKEELAADEPSLIVSAAPCVLHDKSAHGPHREVNDEICKKCGLCLKLGCPAMEVKMAAGDKKARLPEIQDMLCAGCGMCEQVCKFGAISVCDSTEDDI
ncbi:MAG: 4Fe-4S binding protein, partial [Phycisphaerae bacterium]